MSIQYKSLGEIRKEIGSWYKARNIFGLLSGIAYSMAIPILVTPLPSIFKLAGFIGVGGGSLALYAGLKSDSNARDLELEYNTHLLKKDLPE